MYVQDKPKDQIMVVAVLARQNRVHCSKAEQLFTCHKETVASVQDKPKDQTVDVVTLARQTTGFSGAELSNLVNEAALMAATNSKPCISAELLDSARDRAIMGVERK